MVHCRIINYFDVNDIITDKQGGFRKGFSTAASIADLTDVLFNAMNKGLTSLAIFVDLRKAFDTVNHDILLAKLKRYGLEGVNLSWCKNYLSNRKQRTLANGTLSLESLIRCGVPQGSVFGPLFFITYVNDLQYAMNGINFQLYADATVIHTAGTDIEDVTCKLQLYLDRFVNWCRSNKLSLNASKTKCMAFGTRQRV